MLKPESYSSTELMDNTGKQVVIAPVIMGRGQVKTIYARKALVKVDGYTGTSIIVFLYLKMEQLK